MEAGRAAGTINHGLKIVRRVLNLAAQEWMDEYGLTWLASAPKVKLLPDTHKRPPYPLNWEEQTKLFQRLPDHLAQMALFAVNTGCRDGEICKLRWEWELKLQSMNTSVFIIPGNRYQLAYTAGVNSSFLHPGHSVARVGPMVVNAQTTAG